MERNEHDLFDQLVREKLTGYTEPPEPAWIKNIHAKKSRVINLYHLYRLMIITALVGAGIFASVQFVPTPGDVQSNSQQTPDYTSTSQSVSVPSTPSSSLRFGETYTSTTGTQPVSTIQYKGSATAVSDTQKKTGKGLSNRSVLTQHTKPVHSTSSPQKNPSLTNTPTIHHTSEAAHSIGTAPEATLKQEDIQTPRDQNKADSSASKAKDAKEEVAECKAAFEYYTSYTGEISFSNTSTVSSKNNIRWSFGDGASSDDFGPAHSYKTSGTYEVTLYVKDVKNGCEDKLTRTIAYKNPNDKITPITINGELYAGSAPVKNGFIELYQYNSQKGGFVLTNTFKTSQTGAYSININRNVRYILKGIPSSDLTEYTATFWGNSADIEGASEIVIMPSEKDNILGYTIELALGEKHKSPDDFKDAPPIASAEQSVLLLDKNNNIVGVGTVNANGVYTIGGNIPPGNYTVVNPATGESSTKTITANEPVTGSIFEKNSSGSTTKTDDKVSVFPNPAENIVNFGVNSDNAELATIIITNAGGVELSRRQVTFTSGFNQTQYDLSNYSPGVYYILVLRGNQQVLSNRVVKTVDTSK